MNRVSPVPHEIGPHRIVRAGRGEDALCRACWALVAHHDPSDLPPLHSEVARVIVRRKLDQALSRLATGKGLYSEASMLTGWLNAEPREASP